MSFEDKRALLQNLFGGTDKDGKRFGVYVEKMMRKDLWVYTIKMVFLEEVGRLESGNKLVIVVVKKTFWYSNVFFYNHLCRPSLFRNIIMKSGINKICNVSNLQNTVLF